MTWVIGIIFQLGGLVALTASFCDERLLESSLTPFHLSISAAIYGLLLPYQDRVSKCRQGMTEGVWIFWVVAPAVVALWAEKRVPDSIPGIFAGSWVVLGVFFLLQVFVKLGRNPGRPNGSRDLAVGQEAQS